MVTAVVIGLIVSVIDVLVLLIIYFGVNHSKISNEEKRKFNKKIFEDGVKNRIKIIVVIVCVNLLIEYLIYDIVFFKGPKSWRKYELESTKIYYSSERFEMSPMVTFVFEEMERAEEKQYIVVEYEEKIKLTDKAPFNKIFNLLKIEVRTGRVEYHVTSVY